MSAHWGRLNSSEDGWYSRGYLPHFAASGVRQFITYRLADSIPLALLSEWADRYAHLLPQRRTREVQRATANALDKGFGECILADTRCAEVVAASLRWGDGRRYRLLAWCVMPNHVHAVAELFAGVRTDQVVQTWKSASAHELNRVLGRQGRVWQRDYFDRYLRDDAHLAKVVEYIEFNPVKAGLCTEPGEWRFSSYRAGGTPLEGATGETPVDRLADETSALPAPVDRLADETSALPPVTPWAAYGARL